MILDGRIALVTGGTSGMGLVVAERLAREGARVVICGRRPQAGAVAIERIAAAGSTADFIVCDVAEEGAADALVAQVLSRHGRLDAVFNNVGVTVPHANVAESSVEAWNRAISINLTGVYLCMRAQLGAMKAGDGGAIVNNSSLAGVTAIAGQAAYVASKFGLIGLTQAAAIEYARDPFIRINAIAPGPILGGMNTAEALAANPERTQRKISVTAMRRMGNPGEVASVVAWLLSEQASYITGAVLPVDGGAAAGKF